MPTVVGVKLAYAGKVLYFDPAGTEPQPGDPVIVSTERGEEFGTVVFGCTEVADDEVVAPLKPVVRLADESDVKRASELAAEDERALETFRQMVERHGLDMKPVAVETLFDGSKKVFYFVAEERVDFRALVRELASTFKTRVDMRQIGVRDEARIVGGVGHCGQQLCCARMRGDFEPVSIRMAKEQDLPLNPLKISGLCGRLMCCLRYEYDAYKDFKQRAPKCGSIVETPKGPGKVAALNTPKEIVAIKLEDGSELKVPLSAMECDAAGGRPCRVRAEAIQAPVPAVAAVLESLAAPSGTVAKAEAAAVEGERSPARRKRRRRTAGPVESAAPEPPKQPDAQRPAPRKRRRRKPKSQDKDAGNTPT
ncbi:stage 0 sporulation family protein [Coriobacteriia bacterium Es71-Z0120]|uniref:PSP1 domain-containing protein n=1 Tax=Parvivirga hydrogeniphila TaxID=2939460 RepID=UPI002260EAAB|nr:stage 0 sporulation family protein [Parvivirga hydrogeniphila]MCL4079297.1 stage 0 sporulation family protein [Parvivirga hydrogeniphila]